MKHSLRLYFDTIRYLRLKQILFRLLPGTSLFLLPKKAIVLKEIPENCIHPFVDKSSTVYDKDEIVLFEKPIRIEQSQDWYLPNQTKLLNYNLHYFDFLSNQDVCKFTASDWISKWLRNNSDLASIGWDPYPTSLRIVNWIKWRLLGGRSVDGMDESLCKQAVILSHRVEYHLLGNHLFANAKALIFAGCFFKGVLADKWLSRGLSILEREIPEQFLDDGAHFELSTTYHATLTEDLLDVINILEHYGQDVPDQWTQTATHALRWMTVMTRPDGLPPLFNDAAYNISPTLDHLLQYAEKIGVPVPIWQPDGLADLKESGYFRYDGGDYTFFGDAGQIGPDYIPGHAHCDMLNFELFAGGRPIIVDTGISTYDVCGRRHLERSTASHNTVQVNNLEQSEIWAAFRVGRRARITERIVGADFVKASHNGYRKLGVTHQRHFKFHDDSILIRDELNPSTSELSAVARFHFHPEACATIVGDEVTIGSIRLKFKGESDLALTQYDYAPEFYKQQPATCLEVRFSRSLETEIRV